MLLVSLVMYSSSLFVGLYAIMINGCLATKFTLIAVSSLSFGVSSCSAIMSLPRLSKEVAAVVYEKSKGRHLPVATRP